MNIYIYGSCKNIYLNICFISSIYAIMNTKGSTEVVVNIEK